MAKTPKSVVLGNALRQARLGRDWKLREFAFRLNKDPAILSRWETGERTPAPDQVARILTVLGVEGDEYENIMTLAFGTHDPQWMPTTLPEQRQQMAAYVEFEENATAITEVNPLLVPGPLQTPDYISAMMSRDDIAAEEIPARVHTRINRQHILDRQTPPQLTAFIGQGALYQNIGGRQTMTAQLRHLVGMASRPRIHLHLIPFGAGWHPGLESTFTLIDSSQINTVAFVGTRRTTLWLHQDYDVNAYKRAVEKVRQVSMSPDDSARFIHELANRMETTTDVPPANLA
ncbi:putative DNA-binding protein [Actinokineospora spheciospongiae]|uniref:Putative DNA-binding protein n=1 Tax=Actinokineospora spheciospongiae TaxID=909613 RepID=W7IX67_9PSEU|nr:helix-turn-helix transcriptional regulator [Actinokineospora spheciospongiae]EWC58604.1 putative DNA-binding protein [Actinokineospora spheciospongiae]